MYSRQPGSARVGGSIAVSISRTVDSWPGRQVKTTIKLIDSVTTRAPPPSPHQFSQPRLLEYLDLLAVHDDAAFLGERAQLLVHGLAAGAQHLGQHALRDVEIYDRQILLDSPVDDGDLA